MRITIARTHWLLQDIKHLETKKCDQNFRTRPSAESAVLSATTLWLALLNSVLHPLPSPFCTRFPTEVAEALLKGRGSRFLEAPSEPFRRVSGLSSDSIWKFMLSCARIYCWGSAECALCSVANPRTKCSSETAITFPESSNDLCVRVCLTSLRIFVRDTSV